MKNLLLKNKISVSFFLAAFFIIFLHFQFHHNFFLGFGKSIFYMDEERTIATWFTVCVGFLIGFLFLNSINKTQKTLTKVVGILTGLFFFFISFDEIFDVHEQISDLVKKSTNLDEVGGGTTSFSWVIPLFFLVILGVGLLINLIVLEKNKIAKIAYLLGMLSFVLVLVFEVIGANHYGEWIYITYVGIEEGLEMIGLCFFLFGVMQKVTIQKSDTLQNNDSL